MRTALDLLAAAFITKAKAEEEEAALEKLARGGIVNFGGLFNRLGSLATLGERGRRIDFMNLGHSFPHHYRLTGIFQCRKLFTPITAV